MAVDFSQNLAVRVEARSLKLSATLVVSPASCGPKQNPRARNRARSAHEKSQTEDFRDLTMEQRAIPNTARRKNNVTEEDILTACSSRLVFPEEEEEDFDDYAHRAASAYLLWPSETSPWGSSCAGSRRALCRACKHVERRAWYLNLVPKEIS